MERDQFDALYNEYAKAIYRFVFIKTSNKDTAEDLTADTFCKFFEFSLDHPEIDSPRALLYRIASNLVIDTYRKKSFRDSKTDRDAEIEQIPSGEDLFKEHSVKEAYSTVREVMKNLKSDYEDMLLLHYIEDLTVKEISEVLKITENSVRVKLHRAQESLKVHIQKVDPNYINPQET